MNQRTYGVCRLVVVLVCRSAGQGFGAKKERRAKQHYVDDFQDDHCRQYMDGFWKGAVKS